MTCVRSSIQGLGTKGLNSQAFLQNVDKRKSLPVARGFFLPSLIVAIWRGWMSLEERNYISWECNDFQRNRDSEGVDRPLSRGHEREVVPSEDAYPLELDSGI
jgi:hypothetical protein